VGGNPIQSPARSYVETLRRWRQNFTAQASQLTHLGFDERFRRLWTMYLTYCEAGFAERRILDVQLLLGKPRRLAAPPAEMRRHVRTLTALS
jgi:cyclopropane-fatty-acyl-phospholipid synthase